jgi:hypothetical protein
MSQDVIKSKIIIKITNSTTNLTLMNYLQPIHVQQQLQAFYSFQSIFKIKNTSVKPFCQPRFKKL